MRRDTGREGDSDKEERVWEEGEREGLIGGDSSDPVHHAQVVRETEV